MTEPVAEYMSGSEEPYCITLFGVVHPTKNEVPACDLDHMELYPEEENGLDILSTALEKFAGKRVKITIVNLSGDPIYDHDPHGRCLRLSRD